MSVQFKYYAIKYRGGSKNVYDAGGGGDPEMGQFVSENTWMAPEGLKKIVEFSIKRKGGGLNFLPFFIMTPPLKGGLKYC